LNVAQLNWKPSPDAWTVDQCLEHPIVINSGYFPILEKLEGVSIRRRCTSAPPVGESRAVELIVMSPVASFAIYSLLDAYRIFVSFVLFVARRRILRALRALRVLRG